MSYLRPPRVHFSGRMAACTPTANNNNYDLVYDPATVTLLSPYNEMTDAAFRQLMRSLELKDLSVIGMGVDEVLHSNWGFYGDNTFWMDGVTITGGELAGGPMPASDPLLGQAVNVWGDPWGTRKTWAAIVDNNPVGNVSSQIFCSTFGVGDPDALGTFGLTAQRTGAAAVPRGHSRWLHMYRNLARFPDETYSAVWQMPLPKDTLTFPGSATSPALKALQDAADAGLGLAVRWATYYFQRTYTDPEMAAMYAAGEMAKNTSEGFIVGTIGAWEPDELGSMMPGRLLLPNPTLMQYAGDPSDPRTFTLGPAVAQVDTDRKVVVVDLVNAFPEITGDIKPPIDQMVKVDLGTATLQVTDASGAVSPVGTFAYDTATYLSGGGLVEIPYDDAKLGPALATGALGVVCSGALDPDGKPVTPVLAEKVLTAESDDRSIYMTEGTTTSVQVRVWQHGGPPPAGTAVLVEEYVLKQTFEAPPMPPGSPPAGGSDAEKFPLKYFLLAPDEIPATLSILPNGGAVVDANGMITLTVTALAPAIAKIRLRVGDQERPTPDPLDIEAWSDIHYINVRVLPSDAYLDALSDEEVTWDRLYDEVLRFWWRMYPVMDQHLDLQDKAACEKAAQLLYQLCDADNWDSTLYMPVTRDMSDGKRRFLQRWCGRVMRGETT
jgi:hypothetical protein